MSNQKVYKSTNSTRTPRSGSLLTLSKSSFSCVGDHKMVRYTLNCGPRSKRTSPRTICLPCSGLDISKLMGRNGVTPPKGFLTTPATFPRCVIIPSGENFESRSRVRRSQVGASPSIIKPIPETSHWRKYLTQCLIQTSRPSGAPEIRRGSTKLIGLT